jgi:hypothetical protein
VRQFNINDLQRQSAPTTPTMTSALHPNLEAGWGDIVQKIIPTVTPNTSYNLSATTSLGHENLILWTGDGKLGMLSFGRDPSFDEDVFLDALEQQGEKKTKEGEYVAEMRRALEMQAREVRWLRGYGL